MDRRRQDSKQLGKAVVDAMKEGLMRGTDSTELVYTRAERCRICNLVRSDLPNAADVLIIIDRELANNSTCKAAVEAVEALVSEWPSEQRPTYAAVRNHANRHLKRDIVMARRLMEAHALQGGIDVETGDGSILNPGGLLALIMQKGSEQVRDGRVTPTVSEAIAASRAMTAIETDRLKARLDEALTTIRALVDVLKEVAPEVLASMTPSTSKISAERRHGVVVIPEAGPGEHRALEEGSVGFRCDECQLPAKSRGGLLQHKRAKHPTVSAS